MAKPIRNLDYIRAKDPRLYEAFSDLIQQHQNVAQQVNGNPIGGPLPPPPIDGLNVTGQNGHFHIQIQHRAEIYRGIQYYAEFADNPGFSSPHVIHMGDSREHTQFLGNSTYYWRAYAAYASSPPSAPAYHGGAVSPQPVSGGGTVGGPALLPPQGSGTGRAGEGLSGPGPVAFRSSTGVPPKRGQSSGGGASGSGGGGLIPSPATGLPQGLGSLGGSENGGGAVGGMQFLTATQSQLAAIAAGLNSSSQVSVYVSDFDHNLIWTGTGWRFDNGERALYIEGFYVDPSPGTGWQLCDGTPGVLYLKSDGTTGTITAPNLVGSPSYLKFGAASTGIHAAVAPNFTGAPDSTGNDGTAQTVQQLSTLGIDVAAHTHQHGFTPHGSVDTTGEPQNIVLRPWLRL